MQSNSSKKTQVTEQQAVAWIKKNTQNLNPNKWRARYLNKLGIQAQQQPQQQHQLHKQQQFENDQYYINFFSQRTSQDIRNRYLSRLHIQELQEQRQKPRKQNQHIFIFDWDDTILCTTYLSSFQFLDIGPQTKALLDKLDECSHRLLARAAQKGQKVYIITNAAKGWVEYSSKIHLPKTHGVIAKSSLIIISARSMFGEEFPGDFARWKIEAFKTILKTTDRSVKRVTNLICIGDSNIEMEAAHSLSKEFEHSLVKTIKFRQNPKPQQLIKQQELVYERMKEIFQSTKNLTIRLERKKSKQKN